MIDGLTVANLKKGTRPLNHGGEVFSLCTCQRTLVVGLGHSPVKYIDSNDSIQKIYNGNEAYQFLLETILGLQSEVVAEYEVVNQFKEAYQKYSMKNDKNTHILTVLEKLFKDQKKIRSNHLMEIGQLSYAGIARKIIHTNATEEKVLILGSGALSHDLINLLKKKYKVYLSARNQEKLIKLAFVHNAEIIPWMDVESYKNFSYIVNTIGTETILFDETFFQSWRSENLSTPTKLFIDLGSPSAISTSLNVQDGVYRLNNIFEESVKLGKEKMDKVENAKKAILELTHERQQSYSMSFPFGWEELQFA